MTTRLLASFNVLENHSKKVLDGHARKSRLLSHAPRCCCSSCRKPDLVLPLTVNCDWDFEFPSARRTAISKHKTTTDINVEQEFLHNKLRVSKPATAASSTTEDSSCKLKEAVHSRVSVCTFTSPEYLPWRIGHRTGESRGGGRLKRKSVRDGQRHSPVSDSQREEVSPVSDDVTADCVPLSLSEELKRENVRVLTPRPPSVYLPLPIVSETYPVVCNSDPYQHKPFTSSGHHFLEDPNPNLNPSPNPSRTTLHSAIVRITDSLQADIMVRERREKEGAREKEREEREREKEREREEKQGVAGPHSVSLWVLSADGRVGKASELGQLPLHSNQLSPPPSSRAHLLPPPPHLLPPPPPRQKRGSSTAVGPVLNGMNPKMSEPLIGSPDYFRPFPSGTSKRLQTSSPREPITGQMDFLFISKPLKHHHEESVSPLVAKQRASREDWRLGQRHLVMLSEEIDVENIRVYGVRIFRSQLGNKTPRHYTSLYLSEHHSHIHDVKTNSLYDSGMEHTLKTCSSYESGSEHTLRPNFPFDPQQAISIPTAENVLLP
ncbi:nuclear receptor corepressor 1 [Salmo salar]|uniref:Nuclear receptor corepressor 1-like n=1 Tax=Salmo salar TaxID=8030 RepID=A0ABM3C9G6_SALSA|nr:nuclear receptor corepressor 1-like [Salmo salar]XP_045543205.1 nuclear receptor corepressor 1-like [Salmo salar]XP_045543206.1 nuclear receptor corepressor 1-like [Salmo salar]